MALLLVLDNCEHVVEAAAALAEAVVALGHGPAEVAAALATVAAPPGRFEVVDHGQRQQEQPQRRRQT